MREQRLLHKHRDAGADLICQCFEESCRDEFNVDWEALFDPRRNGAAWGAFDGDLLAGYLAWVDLEPIGSDLYTLQWGCVHPEFRHQKVLHALGAAVLRDMSTAIANDGLVLTKTWPVKPILRMGFAPVPGYTAQSGKVLLSRPIALDIQGAMMRRRRNFDPMVVPPGIAHGAFAKGVAIDQSWVS